MCLVPRYFFHTRINDETVADPDGRSLRDPDQAWEAARALALQLLQGAATDPELLQAVLLVEDEAGEVVLEFPLSEAVTVQDGPPAPDGTTH